MSTEKGKRRKSPKFPVNPKIAKQEIITDQSDPRMIKFREDHGEFKPGYPRKTVKLEITKYEAGPDEMKLQTVVGFYEGEPPPEYTAFFRHLFEKVELKMKEEQEREKLSQDLNISIRDYTKTDRKSVLQLWKECKLTHSWDEPAKDISRRLKVSPDLFIVGSIGEKIIATCIGRCDENRGWIEYLGVETSFRRKGIAKQLLKIVEERLFKKGCFEVNLFFDPDNAAAFEFTQRAGYRVKNMTIMGKYLHDI